MTVPETREPFTPWYTYPHWSHNNNPNRNHLDLESGSCDVEDHHGKIRHAKASDGQEMHHSLPPYQRPNAWCYSGSKQAIQIVCSWFGVIQVVSKCFGTILMQCSECDICGDFVFSHQTKRVRLESETQNKSGSPSVDFCHSLTIGSPNTFNTAMEEIPLYRDKCQRAHWHS